MNFKKKMEAETTW